MNATIDETNPIPTDEKHRQQFSRYPCWPTLIEFGLRPNELVGWDSPATQFRRSNSLEAPLACFVRARIKPVVTTVPRSALAEVVSA